MRKNLLRRDFIHTGALVILALFSGLTLAKITSGELRGIKQDWVFIDKFCYGEKGGVLNLQAFDLSNNVGNAELCKTKKLLTSSVIF
jgi:hypothetical protein